ncbi:MULTISPECIES: glucose-6-phosphate dehydrogenase [Amylolactobacillus]|nr:MULTISPECIES: glucose-6-phosphate dehydrogenase [Amylolactobacillus]APT18068.1 glucose-6-phosphate dehydrogenase [Amylolactobacillus amylophilus DSM 20533 = JCM 1125]GED80572.1 glucose-6-phosphate 1-dehydrogenase [Amylolactobacillus amylophilus]
MQTEISTTFIIFGGSGDLAHRKLYPALFNLYKRGFIKEHFAVIGTARRPWSHEYFQNIVTEAIEESTNDTTGVTEFASHFYYQSHDVTDTEHYKALNQLSDQLEEKYQTHGNRIFYMAMSPRFFGTIATHIHDEHILGRGFNRLIIEKPFGNNLESATVLNKQINASFDEEDVYRIDHYLGKEMIQDILPLRFSNPIMKAIWNADNIASIQITLAEQLGVEARGGYYETAGALRDMVQNHIFQIATVLAMPEPKNLTAHEIHESKQAVLNSLVEPDAAELAHDFVRGQYAGDEDTLAYVAENQVSPDSSTETFIAGKIKFGVGPLAGVPIYIRTGKRMAVKQSVVNIIFKNTTNLYDDASQNVLTLEIDPTNTISLVLNGKRVAHAGLKEQRLIYEYEEHIKDDVPDAYERLIGDALVADCTNFTNWHELKSSWQYIDRIEQFWAQAGKKGLHQYPPFCMGPKEANQIFESATDKWI